MGFISYIVGADCGPQLRKCGEVTVKKPFADNHRILMASTAISSSKEFSITLPSSRSSEALARIQQFMKDHRMRWKDMPGGFAEFEAKLHERLAAYERELLAEEMRGADIDSEAIEVEGVAYRRVLRCEQTYLTAAGPVQIERALYKDRTDEAERAIVPMELRLGIVEGYWTPLAAKNAAWVVSQMTPQLAEELFERLGDMQPSKSSLDRLPKALSARWEEEREQFEQALRQSDVIPPHAVTVAVSLDGVLAPTKDGQASQKRANTAAEGRLTRGPAGYREVGCGTLSFYDAQGEMLAAVRMGRMPELKKRTLKRSLLLDIANVLAERPDLQLVKVADGTADNWSFLSKQLPAGTEIVDFFHAAEYLNSALGAAYGEGSIDARRRFQDLRFALKEVPDGVEEVIHSLAYLQKKHPSKPAIETALRYFRKRRDRMRYKEYQDRGLPIGSGVVEAACKTLVTQRMKQSGMRWGEEGGQAILTIRGWTQSGGRFDRAWALLAATYQSEVVTLHNVIPFPGPTSRKPRRKMSA
jgi:hypothetical protein